MQGLADEFGFAIGKPCYRARPDAVDRQPFAAGLDNHFERRTTEPIEQQPAERLEALVAGDAEADQELELALALKVGAPGAAVQLLFEIGKRVLVELLLAQFEHSLNGGHNAMAARLR